VIDLYELLGNPTILLIEPPGPFNYLTHWATRAPYNYLTHEATRALHKYQYIIEENISQQNTAYLL
jgi:hypothetical protein